MEEWRAKQNKANTNEWLNSINVNTAKVKPVTSFEQEAKVIHKKEKEQHGYDYYGE